MVPKSAMMEILPQEMDALQLAQLNLLYTNAQLQALFADLFALTLSRILVKLVMMVMLQIQMGALLLVQLNLAMNAQELQAQLLTATLSARMENLKQRTLKFATMATLIALMDAIRAAKLSQATLVWEVRAHSVFVNLLVATAKR
jgi:hypothetical protein